MTDDEADIAGDPHDEIARLESRIEELADSLERSRKIAMFSKVVLVVGLVWLTAEVFGFSRLGAPGTMGSIAAILASLILSGSNRSTMLQTQTQFTTAQDRRNALIGMIDLRVVDPTGEPGTPRLH